MNATYQQAFPVLFLLRTNRGPFIVSNETEDTVFTLRVGVASNADLCQCPINGLALLRQMSARYRAGKELLGFIPYKSMAIGDDGQPYTETGFQLFYIKSGNFAPVVAHDGITYVVADWSVLDSGIQGLGYG
jgi:hypothetical protein